MKAVKDFRRMLHVVQALTKMDSTDYWWVWERSQADRRKTPPTRGRRGR